MASTEVPGAERQLDVDTAWLRDLVDAVGEVLVGQRDLVEHLLIGLLTGGHVLLEGVPGLAKSLAVSTLAEAVDANFARVQFTPDLLPSDLVGTEIYLPQSGTFEVRRGPIFANFVLADEINRAPAKVQSALLEGMQERQVSIGGTTFPLPAPFLVLATQNPVEQEGTYPLPEAQLDRFALKVVLDYPDQEEELAILDRMARTSGPPKARKVATLEQLLEAQPHVDAVHLDTRLKQYVVRLVHATRRPAEFGLDELAPLIQYGASPRATITLVMAARASAFLAGRTFVTPGDIKHVAPAVLRHRVHPTFEAEATGTDSDAIVRRLLERVEVP
jgi:MoxR-like ATPase